MPGLPVSRQRCHSPSQWRRYRAKPMCIRKYSLKTATWSYYHSAVNIFCERSQQHMLIFFSWVCVLEKMLPVRKASPIQSDAVGCRQHSYILNTIMFQRRYGSYIIIGDESEPSESEPLWVPGYSYSRAVLVVLNTEISWSLRVPV